MVAKLRMSQRLYGGFGLLIALTIIAGSTGYVLIQNVVDGVRTSQSLSSHALGNLETGRLIESMRLAALHFAVSGEEKWKAEFYQDADKATKDITTQRDEAISPQRKALYGEVKEGLEAERKNFDATAVAPQSNNKTALVAVDDQLSIAVTQLMDDAAKTKDARLIGAVASAEHAVLVFRTLSWRFLAAPSANGAKEYQEAAEHARTALEQIGRTPGVNRQPLASVRTVNDGISQYEKAVGSASGGASAGDIPSGDKIQSTNEMVTTKMDEARSSLLDSANTARLRADTALSTAETLQVASIVIVLVLGSFLAFTIARGIVRPLSGMTGTMRTMAAGDTNVVVPDRDRSDEIGEMAAAVQIFKESMIERQRMSERERIEQGEKERRSQALQTLNTGFSAAFREVGDGIMHASTAVDGDSKTLTTSAMKTREQADAVARASAGASSNVQTVASAAEQLRASIAEINHQVVSAATASTEAVEQSARAGETVKGLAVAADRIGQVVDLINSIASQTNLLALNATIEAARAGDAGKGFAVVAAEVKGLANQTANATGEIQAQVGAIQQETSRAVQAITEIGKTIGSIQEITTSVAGAVEQQSAATAEISRSVQQASLGSQEVAQAIALVSSATDTTAFAIESLRQTSEQLSTHARLLQTQVTDFIDQARAI